MTHLAGALDCPTAAARSLDAAGKVRDTGYGRPVHHDVTDADVRMINDIDCDGKLSNGARGLALAEGILDSDSEGDVLWDLCADFDQPDAHQVDDGTTHHAADIRGTRGGTIVANQLGILASYGGSLTSVAVTASRQMHSLIEPPSRGRLMGWEPLFFGPTRRETTTRRDEVDLCEIVDYNVYPHFDIEKDHLHPSGLMRTGRHDDGPTAWGTWWQLYVLGEPLTKAGLPICETQHVAPSRFQASQWRPGPPARRREGAADVQMHCAAELASRPGLAVAEPADVGIPRGWPGGARQVSLTYLDGELEWPLAADSSQDAASDGGGPPDMCSACCSSSF